MSTSFQPAEWDYTLFQQLLSLKQRPRCSEELQVDVSALGTFSGGTLLMIDDTTNVADGPTATSVTLAAQMTISFDGYGVAFLTLKP